MPANVRSSQQNYWNAQMQRRTVEKAQPRAIRKRIERAKEWKKNKTRKNNTPRTSLSLSLTEKIVKLERRKVYTNIIYVNHKSIMKLKWNSNRVHTMYTKQSTNQMINLCEAIQCICNITWNCEATSKNAAKKIKARHQPSFRQFRRGFDHGNTICDHFGHTHSNNKILFQPKCKSTVINIPIVEWPRLFSFFLTVLLLDCY